MGGKPHVRNFSFTRPTRSRSSRRTTACRAGAVPDAAGGVAEILASRPVERTARPHRRQPAAHHHVDQGREVHGLDRDGKAAPDKGGIGLQVHGGGDFTKQFVRYRNIRIKRLSTTDR